jgi:ABC-2 type transport system permease protein
MALAFSWRRTASVARKEVLHMLRDPATLFFALAIPVIEMLMLGYAIDTNVKHIATVVYDAAGTQESRRLIESLINSEDFRVVAMTYSDAELHRAIVSGRARVAVKVPEDYSRRLLAGETAQVLILVDGSESSVAGEAVNVGNAVALQDSLRRALGDRPLPIDSRPRVLFNPDTRSANFFIPGLLVVLCQMMATMLTANSIVREKENGTLEQLFMTPVRPHELMIGKLTPYFFLTLLEFCGILLLMRTIFQVPINGPVLTLLGVAFPFILTMLGIGLLISTRAGTKDAAMQMVMGSFLPSVFLSGYVFPTDSMPWGFKMVSWVIPTTWLIDAARGVILRGADWGELWLHALVLSGMAVTFLTLSSIQFKKKIS